MHARSSSRLHRSCAALLVLVSLVACGDDPEAASGPGPAGGGGGGGGGSTGSGEGGTGAGNQVSSLDEVLAELRADTEKALLARSSLSGWPVPTDAGYLFVTTHGALHRVAGDHDAWAGTETTADEGFRWVALEVPEGSRYKLTDGATFAPDPWARSSTYDEFGELSLVAPPGARLDRYFGVGDAKLSPRTLRVWVPAGPVERVLYVHDGQNLFDPDAMWGGWKLSQSVPPGVLVVGIDNTPARMEEYTHVEDVIGGKVTGGSADEYAELLQGTVRPLVRARYGEVGPVGVMGSSLGGLVSLHVAHRYPGEFAFAASLSGTLGWGSIGAANETMIERYGAASKQPTVLYVDSGGSGECWDGDGDGIEDDDPSAKDNYCENRQMRDVLVGVGHVLGEDLFYHWEPGAAHNEAAWASRVFRPLEIFAEL